MLDVDRWCVDSYEAVLSLWDPDRGRAWRNSAEKAEANRRYRPTVTFNVLSVIEEFGGFSESYVEGIKQVTLEPGLALRSLSPFTHHFAHTSHRNGPRRLIFLAHYLRCVRLLSRYAVNVKDRSIVSQCASQATKRFCETFDDFGTGEKLAMNLTSSPHLSAFLLGYADGFVADRSCIQQTVDVAHEKRVLSIESGMRRYFEREVHRLMAHREIGEDPGFDGASLCFALKGLVADRGREFRRSAFFASCVQAVCRAQNPDGTWPDGVCALVPDNADTMQQPSVKIALTLLHVAFDNAMLVRGTETEMAVLKAAMPSFDRMAQFLATTFSRANTSSDSSGWVSDRVRWPNTADTWLTTLAARFFHAYRLAQQSVLRADILAKLSARWPGDYSSAADNRLREWRSKVAEPDHAATPCAVIERDVVQPIVKQQSDGRIIVRPHRNGVSLIIFGPPGSGKTYFVDQVAAVLGWPVIDLNPGHFIKDGAELIETRAHQLFEQLFQLNHAVVFFDECDELFLDREESAKSARNVLSFVTASMLPKLQQLHDRRCVVFVLATNYLSRVDSAVRRPGRFDHVLLFDRPDEPARRKLLARRVTKRALPSAVKVTNGMTTKEILDGLRAHTWQNTSLSDYRDWCRDFGAKELGVSRYPENVKQQIVQRWASVTSTEGTSIQAGKRVVVKQRMRQ